MVYSNIVSLLYWVDDYITIMDTGWMGRFMKGDTKQEVLDCLSCMHNSCRNCKDKDKENKRSLDYYHMNKDKVNAKIKERREKKKQEKLLKNMK